MKKDGQFVAARPSFRRVTQEFDRGPGRRRARFGRRRGAAQFFDRPPADVAKQGADAPSQDTSALLRIDRLESQVRGLNGQIEQLQFQIKRLEDGLRKFQSDADSRLDQPSDHAAPRHRSDLNGDPNAGTAVAANVPPPADPGAPAAAAAPDLPPPVAAADPDGRRHDAFSPSAQPNAPGAPLPLGSPGSASKPLDMRPPSLRGGDAAASAETPGPSAASPAAQTAALPPADPVKGRI